MPYVESSLILGENIVCCGRVHWAVFLPSLFILVLGTICLVVGIMFIKQPETSHLNEAGYALAYPGLALYFISLITLAIELIFKLTTELAITNQRVIAKAGLISRRTLEMNIAKVENIQLDQ